MNQGSRQKIQSQNPTIQRAYRTSERLKHCVYLITGGGVAETFAALLPQNYCFWGHCSSILASGVENNIAWGCQHRFVTRYTTASPSASASRQAAADCGAWTWWRCCYNL